MNISFVSSEKFLYGAKVMLISFLENNDFEKHNIFWLYNNVSEKKIKRFCNYFKKNYNQTVTPFELTREMLDRFYVNCNFGVAAFHKLFVFDLLPIKCDRILSLDADAIVDSCLKDFYYQDMTDYCVAASDDMWITDKELEKRGYTKEDRYINLGNSLFNLDNYLNEYSIEYLTEYVEKNKKLLTYVAQDVVNFLYKDKIKYCNPYKYNLQIYSGFLHSERASEQMKENVKNAINDNPSIIHYVRGTKPWSNKYKDGYGYYFDKYEKKIYKLKGTYRIKRFCIDINDFIERCIIATKRRVKK